MARGFENKETARKAGQKGKPTKHKKTLEWEALGNAIKDKHAKRFNSILVKLSDDKFIPAYTGIVKYFEPVKTQANITSDQPIRIEFLNVSGEPLED